MNAHRPRFGHWLLVVAAMVAMAGAILLSQRTWEPIQRLTSEQRRVLYDSNWNSFVATCHALPSDLGAAVEGLCRQQAELLHRMPECDSECQRRTSEFTNAQPTR